MIIYRNSASVVLNPHRKAQAVGLVSLPTVVLIITTQFIDHTNINNCRTSDAKLDLSIITKHIL